MGRPTSRRFEPPPGEPALPRAERRAGGVYYTPPEIVRELVRLTLGIHRTQRLSVLDPACGAGAMLAEVAAQYPAARLLGVDCDPAAVAAASGIGGARVWCGDALFDERLDRAAPLDAIVGNPPYVNIRQLARSQPAEYVARLRERFRTARGNFDLYVPFVERALALLRDGGRCGMIVPNKWQTLDYARPLRELLLAETTILRVVDLSSLRVFAGASVYPQIVVFARSPPPRSHAVLASTWAELIAGDAPARIVQHELTAETFSLVATIDVESRVTTRPLGEIATLSCGTAGYSARRIAAALCEREEIGTAPAADFITSGNIDRGAIRLGDVRFLGRTYRRPQLPLDAAGVTARQRRLFAGQKIVIAGLAQRIEAAWDDRGLALGVQVFAASECRVDPRHLLAVLNSKLLTYLFRTRFGSKRLAGGYLSFNKGQLARLPIAVDGEGVGSLWRAKSFRHGKIHSAKDSRPPGAGPDALVDQRVYRLYRLSAAEIATVEAHFANLGRRAA